MNDGMGNSVSEGLFWVRRVGCKRAVRSFLRIRRRDRLVTCVPPDNDRAHCLHFHPVCLSKRPCSKALEYDSRTSQLSMGQTEHSPTCSIMEKPHTGLDECPRILLSCFTARNSVGARVQQCRLCKLKELFVFSAHG